ncbi:tetratricopeptide (TPR) repeat protein [Actinomadura coerulea]|uniref:Tetratricopeptide (TPR) repeat protein n=1 Tax=Actinomadura coerulea TaxID=46159 RepID=A0A7X0FYS8_9ACTN|nr:tetratricopeptide repeat protein [Actinomadura coerulea]MBB6396201.1 tetratricopeptide (TPR) repeat protein [Actinomadura coerulea]
MIGTDDARTLYDELRVLRERARTRRRAAGEVFSLREIERALTRPPYAIKFRGQAISDWLPEDAAKAQVPRDADVVWALVRLWSDWAGDGQPAERHWRGLVERAQPARVPPSAAAPAGRPIGEFGDRLVLEDLEVQPAVDLTGAVTGAAGLGLLPAYVRREHDWLLQAVVDAAKDGHSGIALLIGGPSSGKTRACWEAVKALPEAWRLWHPLTPTRAQAVIDGLPAVGPRTVVWLNDSQHYLLDPDRAEQVASGLRDLLNDAQRAPVLVVGSIWHEDWATLSTVPAPGQWTSGRHPDPFAQARQLVGDNGIIVPEYFTGDDLKAARDAATGDPRLVDALQHAEQGHITQYLAGVPALLERYRTAYPAAKALIKAAMDALRTVPGLPLTRDLLEEAAEGYLTGVQFDLLEEAWFEAALASLSVPQRGTRGPLTPIRPRCGQPAPARPSYRLAPYLEHHGRVTRRTTRAPAALWEALLHYQGAPAAILGQFGQRAKDHGLLRTAVRFYAAAADAGYVNASRRTAGLLEDAGRIEEAISWWQQAADGDDYHGINAEYLARLLESLGRAEEALHYWQRSADLGNPVALEKAGRRLVEFGRVDDAVRWWQRAADLAGDDQDKAAYYSVQAAELLVRAGPLEEALAWWLRAVGTSSFMAQWADTPRELHETGQADEAVQRLRAHAANGTASDANVAKCLRLLHDASNHVCDVPDRGPAAEHADTADPQDPTTAEPESPWYATRWDEVKREANQLAAQGSITDEIIDLLLNPPDAHHGLHFELVSAILWVTGRQEEAIRHCQQAAEHVYASGGYTSDARYAALRAAYLLRQIDRTQEAIGWLQNRAETGDDDAAQKAVWLLLERGEGEHAIDWLTHAAAAGHRYALALTADVLAETGHITDADKLRQYGWEPDGSIAEPWTAAPPAAHPHQP